MLFLLRGWTQKKNWRTAIVDSAIYWQVIIVNKCVYRENKLDEKWFFRHEVWLGKVQVENEPGFHDLWGHLLLPAYNRPHQESIYKIKIYRENSVILIKTEYSLRVLWPLLLCVLLLLDWVLF